METMRHDDVKKTFESHGGEIRKIHDERDEIKSIYYEAFINGTIVTAHTFVPSNSVVKVVTVSTIDARSEEIGEKSLTSIKDLDDFLKYLGSIER